MPPRAQPSVQPAPPEQDLEPEILAIIQALARANARRDYAAAQRAAGLAETQAP